MQNAFQVQMLELNCFVLYAHKWKRQLEKDERTKKKKDTETEWKMYE